MICILRMQCSNQHTLFALAGEYATLADAERHRETIIEDAQELTEQGIICICEYCGSETTLPVEVFPSPWRTLEQTHDELERQQLEQMITAGARKKEA